MNTTGNRNIIIYVVIAVIVAFLAGFGWQYVRANSVDRERARLHDELVFKRLETMLAAALIEADRGNYESSRQLSSEFFTALQQHISEAPQNTHQELTAIMHQRDDVITAASRGSSETSALLGQIYNTYRVAFGDAPVGVTQPAAQGTTGTATTTSQ